METTTCQICGRAIKASTGLIAHHGYKRPYQAGWQSASCAGARYLPYEQSCERLREVIGDVEKFIERITADEKVFLENPPEKLIGHVYAGFGRHEPREYTKPENFTRDSYNRNVPNTYENAYADREYDYKQTIRGAKSDLETMKRRLADWKPASAETTTIQEDNMSYDENAGYVAYQKFENSDIVLYNAKKAGIDVDGRFAIVCETHGRIVGATSVPNARLIMKSPNFCEKCMGSSGDR